MNPRGGLGPCMRRSEIALVGVVVIAAAIASPVVADPPTQPRPANQSPDATKSPSDAAAPPERGIPGPAAAPSAPRLSDAERAALRSLVPTSPERYLELAEDLLDHPDDPGRVQIAEQLLVRAIHFGATVRGHERTAASAALALAERRGSANDRRWLRSVAAALHPDYAAIEREVSVSASDAAASVKAAEAITRVRADDPLAAEELRDEQVRQVLKAWDQGSGAVAGLTLRDLEQLAARPACSTCQGQRMVSGGARRTDPKICPACVGRSRWNLTRPQLEAVVRLQIRLLQGEPRDWSSQVALDQAMPARDPDPLAVASALRVDTRLTRFDEGQWLPPP